MTANLNLLGMPPEIRFAIYNAYVAIDYALQLTCKQIAHEIAHEMRGLALRRNTVNIECCPFSPHPDHDVPLHGFCHQQT